MKTFVVLAAVICAANALSLDHQFNLFKIQHAKKYNTAVEHEKRKAIFADNMKTIAKHNAEEALGLHTFTMGVNKFADMTHEEFVAAFTAPKKTFATHPKRVATAVTSDLPDTVDWRTEGYVTPIKDQGQCGSCWTFSATGAMEGAVMKSSGSLPSLSEQNLMDCVHPMRDGCQGGSMEEAFQYVIDNGIMSEDAYPYKAKDSGFNVCNFEASESVAQMTDYTSVGGMFNGEKSLQEAVANVGPISVGIDASHGSFQLYHSGVYTESSCSSFQLDHGVLAVGYGEHDGTPYWLVKNSWGTSWGMEGYIMMARNHNNMCGIATDASYPTAA